VQITRVGKPIASFYLLEKIGIFKDKKEIDNSALFTPDTYPGDIKFKDVNGDGVINSKDREIVGNPWPNFTWGMNNAFSYKNLSLNIMITGSQGAMTFLRGRAILNRAGVQNQLQITENNWSPDHKVAKWARPIRSDYAKGISNSSKYLFSSSYMRINEIGLNYTLPQSLVSKMDLRKLDFGFEISNLYTITNYPLFNPQASSMGGNVKAAGYDYYAYPLPRTFNFEVKISF
jgi:hypothetical protein